MKRSLYIGDVLYTISAKQIKANSLGDVNTTLATITLLPGDVLYPVVKGEYAGENYLFGVWEAESPWDHLDLS